METFNNNLGAWPSFLEGGLIDGGPGTWDSDNSTDNYNTTGWPVDDPVSLLAATLPNPFISDPNFPGQLLGSSEVFIDYNMPMAVPEFLLETAVTSPNNSVGMASTPGSGDFGPIGSPTISDIGLSPFPLIEQSPRGWWDSLESPIINTTPEPFVSQPNTNTYIEEASISGAAPTIAPGVSVYQPSPQRTQTHRQPNIKNCPPGMSAYVSLP